MSDYGYRALAAAIVRNAYQEYWDHYIVYRRSLEINKRGFAVDAQHKMERIEGFFKSEWYTEILCGISPTISRIKFEKDFKDKLSEKYEELKRKGKKGCDVGWLFTEERHAGA